MSVRNLDDPADTKTKEDEEEIIQPNPFAGPEGSFPKTPHNKTEGSEKQESNPQTGQIWQSSAGFDVRSMAGPSASAGSRRGPSYRGRSKGLHSHINIGISHGPREQPALQPTNQPTEQPRHSQPTVQFSVPNETFRSSEGSRFDFQGVGYVISPPQRNPSEPKIVPLSSFPSTSLAVPRPSPSEPITVPSLGLLYPSDPSPALSGSINPPPKLYTIEHRC